MSVVLAVARREVLAATRRESLHRFRLAVAALGAGITAAAAVAVSVGALPAPRLGRVIFDAAALLTGALGLLVGAILTAGMLSEERRDGTLPLLRLAGADGLRLLAGKGIGALLPALGLLLGLQPFVALGFLMGGVAGGEWLRALLAAAAGLLFSACVGLACSAVARRPAAALWSAVLISGGVGLAWPLAEHALRLVHSPNAVWALPDGVIVAPFIATLAALNTPSPTAETVFARAIVGMVGGSGIALLVAWWALRRERFRGESVAPPARARRPVPVHASGYSLVPPVGAVDRCVVGAAMLGTTLLLGFVAWQAFEGGPIHLGLSLGALAAAHVGLKLMVAREAARLAAEDQTGGALELFCTIPAGEVWLRRSWQEHLRRLSFAPMVGLLAVDAVLLARGLRDPYGDFTSVPWLAVVVALMVLLPADVWTLSVVGLREGVRHGSPVRAFYGALWRVFGLPLPFFLFNAAVLLAFAAMLDLAGPAVMVACWVIWGLVVNVALGARAFLALTDGLRQEAEGA